VLDDFIGTVLDQRDCRLLSFALAEMDQSAGRHAYLGGIRKASGSARARGRFGLEFVLEWHGGGSDARERRYDTGGQSPLPRRHGTGMDGRR
jgi:hypothetical protein